jgi:hypothetical protein
VTLVELLTAMAISTIALFGLAIPFVAERNFWSSGESQTEAQRDAQLILGAMAFIGREASVYTVSGSGDQITFRTSFSPAGPGPCDIEFRGGPSLGGQLEMEDDCAGQTTVLIDGNRSVVTNFIVNPISPRLVQIRLEVTHGGRRDELLETQIFLRNA